MSVLQTRSFLGRNTASDTKCADVYVSFICVPTGRGHEWGASRQHVVVCVGPQSLSILHLIMHVCVAALAGNEAGGLEGCQAGEKTAWLTHTHTLLAALQGLLCTVVG